MILHVDGDAFFVGCELTRRPDLLGLPVVTGAERGIASAMSYEAKSLGITRGMPIFKLRKLFPEVIVLPGDYELYEQMSKRMYAIVRRFSDKVEEYSIDECFAVLEVGPRVSPEPRPLEDIAREIKLTLQRELGMTFSVGLAPTKVLAKLASKRDKPDGCVCVTPVNFESELYNLDIEKVWGIGRQSVSLMRALGICTVGNFSTQSEAWVRRNWNVNFLDLWRELRGEQVYKVGEGDLAKHKSIQKTRTFHPSSSDSTVLMGQLAKNCENAFGYARSLNLSVQEASIFIKSEKFCYRVTKFKFPVSTQTPELLLAQVRARLLSLIQPREKYRATGVTLINLTKLSEVKFSGVTQDLFGQHEQAEKMLGIHIVADNLYGKYGGRVLTIASALSARNLGYTQGDDRPRLVY